MHKLFLSTLIFFYDDDDANWNEIEEMLMLLCLVSDWTDCIYLLIDPHSAVLFLFKLSLTMKSYGSPVGGGGT